MIHLNAAEGILIGDAEEHFFVFNPGEAKMKQRDTLAHDASRLFSQFFSRLSNDEDKEMMNVCFVETAESKKAEFELQKIVENVLNGISSIDTNQGSALQEEIERTLDSMRSERAYIRDSRGIDRPAQHHASGVGRKPVSKLPQKGRNYLRRGFRK